MAEKAAAATRASRAFSSPRSPASTAFADLAAGANTSATRRLRSAADAASAMGPTTYLVAYAAGTVARGIHAAHVNVNASSNNAVDDPGEGAFPNQHAGGGGPRRPAPAPPAPPAPSETETENVRLFAASVGSALSAKANRVSRSARRMVTRAIHDASSSRAGRRVSAEHAMRSCACARCAARLGASATASARRFFRNVLDATAPRPSISRSNERGTVDNALARRTASANAASHDGASVGATSSSACMAWMSASASAASAGGRKRRRSASSAHHASGNATPNASATARSPGEFASR